MPRARRPQRDQAFAIFQEHGGNITNREIAKQLDIPERASVVGRPKIDGLTV